jgi:uncharacterized protein YyaL (SSP411 family)
MRKPAFYVVTSTVAILVLVGFIATLVRPHIPLPTENELAAEDSVFLNRAATQEIEWSKPTKEAFARARRRDMPILLFIGNGFNPRAMGLDYGVLMSPRIQALLARNFECIRVDSLENPEFRNAFLPLSKFRLEVQPGFQLWVLDPSGRIMDNIPSMIGIYPTDENLFARELVEARDRFESIANRKSELELAQEADLKVLTGDSRVVSPAFSDYSRLIGQSVVGTGGFSVYGPRTLAPEAWRWLLSTGQEGLFHDSLDPVLQTGVVDLIDGGFFVGSRDENWLEIDCAKSAVQNANMLQLLAAASVVLGDEVYKYLAERTFDCLLDEFVLENGVAAYRASDQRGDRRSPRASFGVRRLLAALPARSELTFAQDSLGLRVEENPRMVPRLSDLGALGSRKELDQVLAKLRRATDRAPEARSPGFADVTGYCVARMIESARIMGDRERLDRALDAFRWVEMARSGVDMRHNARPEFALDTYAGDYLGYADAALQVYLATGRYSALQSGRGVLVRCLEKFGKGPRGTLRMALDREAPFPWTVSLPELYDTEAPSAIAHAVVLAEDYGRIFGSDDVLVRFVNGAIGRFGPAAFTLKERGAGFFNAARRAFEDEYFVATGPKAQELADGVAKRHPFRLCLPAFGDVRGDIQERGTGIFVVRGETVRGPFGLERAVQEASPFLGAGP